MNGGLQIMDLVLQAVVLVPGQDSLIVLIKTMETRLYLIHYVLALNLMLLKPVICLLVLPILGWPRVMFLIVPVLMIAMV